MASVSITNAAVSDAPRQGTVEHAELLLRETNHRCANDLQLVVSLLSLQGRRAENPEVSTALMDAAARVGVLARARTGLSCQQQPDLGAALRQVCEALHSQAEPRGILMSLEVERDVPGLSEHQIATIALAVNELATNAIKHAFHEGQGGRISISLRRTDSGEVVVIVDDDGLPLPNTAIADGGGMGFGLVHRLVGSVGGSFVAPAPGSKRFQVKLLAPTHLNDSRTTM